jgi:hypothetical protein
MCGMTLHVLTGTVTPGQPLAGQPSTAEWGGVAVHACVPASPARTANARPPPCIARSHLALSQFPAAICPQLAPQPPSRAHAFCMQAGKCADPTAAT